MKAKSDSPEITIYIDPDLDDAVDAALMTAERDILEGQRIMNRLFKTKQ